MRAGKRRQTETKQTRSCNVVLKKLSDKFIPPIRSTLRSSKLTADITETQKKVQQKTKTVALKQKIQEQPGKITAKTTLKPASAKQSTTQAAPLRRNPDNIVTRRSTIVDTANDDKTSFAVPKVSSLSIRLSKFRRNSVASDIITKKTTETNFQQAKVKDTASTSKAALTAALKSAVRNANVASLRTGVRLSAEPKAKSDTKANLKIETKPSVKATEFRNKNYGKIIAKSDVKYAATVTTANASNSQSANPTSKTKMFKQTKLVSIASNPQTPPTIAASRSRRSIKPNPKYASEDIVTPKYVTALASDSPQSRRSYARGNEDRFADSGDDFFSREADDFIDDDNDDDIADEAFDPRTQNSDEDLSDLEIYGNDNVVHPRRRGRPGKASQVATSGRNTKSSASMGQQRSSIKTAPTQLQQLRRTMALSVPRVTVTPGANKRKIVDDDNAGNSEVPRKRMVISSGVSVAKPTIVSSSLDNKRVVVRRSVPLVNGANKSTVSGTPITVGTKIIAGNRASITAQNSASAKLTRSTTMYQVTGKTEKATPTMSRINATSTKTIKPTVAKQPSKDPAEGQTSNVGDDTHTFTIVNIDDIINQDDVLISKTSGQHVARKQAGAKSSPGDASNAARANSSAVSDGSTQAKRQPFKTRTPTATKQIVTPPQVNKAVSNPKPAPRILNSEVGKRTQPMKPLMNMVDDMAKDLRPVMGSAVAEGEFELDDDDILDDEIATTPPMRSQMAPRRTVFRNTVTPTGLRAAETKKSSGSGVNTTTTADQKRRLASLLCDDEENTATFKKPDAKENSLAATNQRAAHTVTKQQKVSPIASGGGDIVTTVTKTQQQHIQLPPETTTVRCEGGRVIRKITCYETWYVISVPKELPHVTRSFLEIPLVKLANVVNRIKMPTSRWSSKVTLYKLSPASMAKQSVVIYTGDLKSHNIPETERHKYQPSCVLFRRAVTDRNQVRLPYDRAIIFKNKSFYTNIEGKHVNLVGAPESISTAKEVETLLDIIDTLTLKSSLVDLITLK